MAILEQSPLYREIVSRSEQRGIEQVAVNMLRMGMAIEQVSEATGLSLKQINGLDESAKASEQEQGN